SISVSTPGTDPTDDFSCFAMFIATGSFFLGQAKLLPESMRIFPLLAVPVVLVLLLMVYWWVRVSFTKRIPQRV
ncbi:MAG TPA: hypothetical protein VF309_05315, partial [Usitatibacter sp.]